MCVYVLPISNVCTAESYCRYFAWGDGCCLTLYALAHDTHTTQRLTDSDPMLTCTIIDVPNEDDDDETEEEKM